jgi:hypothetical protein
MRNEDLPDPTPLQKSFLPDASSFSSPLNVNADADCSAVPTPVLST